VAVIDGSMGGSARPRVIQGRYSASGGAMSLSQQIALQKRGVIIGSYQPGGGGG
jgi:hypothetical protein